MPIFSHKNLELLKLLYTLFPGESILRFLITFQHFDFAAIVQSIVYFFDEVLLFFWRQYSCVCINLEGKYNNSRYELLFISIISFLLQWLIFMFVNGKCQYSSSFRHLIVHLPLIFSCHLYFPWFEICSYVIVWFNYYLVHFLSNTVLSNISLFMFNLSAFGLICVQ